MGLRHATLPWTCPSLSWVSLNILKQGAPSRGLIIRDESFPREHPQDSYNQPQVRKFALVLIRFQVHVRHFWHTAFHVTCPMADIYLTSNVNSYRPQGYNSVRRRRVFAFYPLFFVLCSYLGRSHHQADACHMASVHLGFCSIWNTHLCLRLQPHLYPVPVATSFGRSDGTRQRYKSTHVEPDALVRTRNYCRIKVSDRQR